MSSTNSPDFYQYCEIIVTNGNYEYTWKKFLLCSTQEGMTESEIADYLADNFNCGRQLDSDRNQLDSLGLKDVFYWADDMAVGVFPRIRDEKYSSSVPVYAQNDPYITLMQKVAPELFN